MTHINQPQYPVGSRLLVAWMIRDTASRMTTHPAGWPTQPEWIENDQIGEVLVDEYSPSGKMVRLSSPGASNYMHTDGWYPITRIIVKEVLEPRSASPA